MNIKSWIGAVAAAATLAGCALFPRENPQDQFFARLAELCGQSFEGRVVTDDPRDAGFANERLVMHVRECSAKEIRIPFHVGDNRSRTWVITRTNTGLRLKHDHRHEDGSEDVLTQYGGDTTDAGSAMRQEFPADDFSKQLFVDNNIPDSVLNTWAVEVRSRGVFAYELRRPNRLFRVEFDLKRPVPAPPPPWGAQSAPGTTAH
jgi:hypothetical protein